MLQPILRRKLRLSCLGIAIAAALLVAAVLLLTGCGPTRASLLEIVPACPELFIVVGDRCILVPEWRMGTEYTF